MNTTSMVIWGLVICVTIGALVALNYYRKKNIEKLFEQVYESAKQVPKQKKNSFLLLMFKESLASAKKKKKNKSKTGLEQLNNPKYLEIQLMQMSSILKDTSKVQDKTVKSALTMLNDYLVWEKAKNSQTKQPTKKAA